MGYLEYYHVSRGVIVGRADNEVSEESRGRGVTASSRACSSMSAMHTVAPRVESSFAVANPIPLAPPVIAMTLPSMNIVTSDR